MAILNQERNEWLKINLVDHSYKLQFYSSKVNMSLITNSISQWCKFEFYNH